VNAHAIRRLILVALFSAAGGASCTSTKATVTVKGTVAVAIGTPACRDAYVEYEARWRLARTEELLEFVAGDADVLEEILFYELASLPGRAELATLRDIYAVIDAFLWDAPWPRALAATGTAIEHCGEKTARPETK
jgi:hypothetical protein